MKLVWLSLHILAQFVALGFSVYWILDWSSTHWISVKFTKIERENML